MRATATATIEPGASSGFRIRKSCAPCLQRANDAHIAFFHAQNLGHADGDELACLTEISAAHLDETLRENPHYALCRDLGQLGPLRCCRIAAGAFDIFCQVGVSTGQRIGDLKPQSLSPRSDWRRHFAATSDPA